MLLPPAVFALVWLGGFTYLGGTFLNEVYRHATRPNPTTSPPPAPRSPPTPTPQPAPSPHSVIRCEFKPLAEMSAIAHTSDGRIAVGTYTGGIDMVIPKMDLSTSECERQLITQLKKQGVTISALGFLSDGSCALVDSSNSIMVFEPRSDRWRNRGVSFEALSREEGGLVSLSVHGYGRNERIYVSYRKAKKIFVFSPSGGKAESKIPCNGYEPWQITCFIKDILLTDDSTVRIIDINGNIKHKRDKPTDLEEKKSRVYPFAGVSRRNTVLIAWVDHNDHGEKYWRVRIDEYTQELKHVKKLFDHKIPKHEKRWWYFVTQLKSGEIAFCTIDKLYIFKPVNPGRGGGEL